MTERDDKKVMDLSNYNSSSPMMVCCGSPVPDTVLRLGMTNRPPSPTSSSAGRGSSSPPQPNRTVITSVASFYHSANPHAASSSPSSHHNHDGHYRSTGSPMYYLPGGSAMSMPSARGPGGLLGGLSSGSTVAVATSSRKKKLPQPIPEECKDDAYWERRKRNNESAKRSREMRRNKEMATSERVNFLESENLQLRTEVAMLRNEVEKLRQLLIPKSSLAS